MIYKIIIGVAGFQHRHHHNGRWEARIGRVLGNKYLYLGTYSKYFSPLRSSNHSEIELHLCRFFLPLSLSLSFFSFLILILILVFFVLKVLVCKMWEAGRDWWTFVTVLITKCHCPFLHAPKTVIFLFLF